MNFSGDDGWQRSVRERVLIPAFHDRYWKGRWRDAEMPDQHRGIDCFLPASAGGEHSIEEKIVRYREPPYTAFALETWSCSVEGRAKSGWMQYSEADFLLYCFSRRHDDSELEAYLLRMTALQEWFWKYEATFAKTTTNQINQTICRVVPVKAACEIALLKQYEFKAKETA